MTFQELILTLHRFWADQGCVVHQPYDSSDLRAFLLPPENCDIPCFMGVRPGVMVSERALAALQAHEWVEEIYLPMDGFFSEWSWSEAAPPFVDTGTRGFLGALSDFNDIYYTMSIKSTIRLSELFLALGKPNLSFFSQSERSGSRLIMHSVYYSNLRLQADGMITCPITLERLGDMPLTLYWGSLPGRMFGDMDTSHTFPNYPRAWLNEQSLC